MPLNKQEVRDLIPPLMELAIAIPTLEEAEEGTPEADFRTAVVGVLDVLDVIVAGGPLQPSDHEALFHLRHTTQYRMNTLCKVLTGEDVTGPINRSVYEAVEEKIDTEHAEALSQALSHMVIYIGTLETLTGIDGSWDRDATQPEATI
jgi:hypothetical protein